MPPVPFPRWHRVLAGLLLAAVTFTGLGSPASAGTADPMAELRKLQEDQTRFEAQLRQVRERKNQKDREHRLLSAELRSAENRLYGLQNDLANLENQLADSERKAAAAATRLQAAENEWKKRNRLLSTRVRVIYELGAVSYLEVLLSATSFGDFLSRFTYLRTILSRDVEVFATAREVRDRIALAKREIEQRKVEIATYKAKTETQKQVVEQATEIVAQRKEMTARDLAILEQQEDELLQIAEEWEAKIAALEAKVKRKRTGKLEMIWPVRGPITSQYGMRIDPISGLRRGHSGMDIATPMGTPIKAAESGVVIHSGWIDGYGYTTILDHGDGISTLYAHSSRLLKRVGAEVAQGETIALVGTTGYSTGPHLHFEVRRNGKTTNPAEWLP